MKVGSVTHPNQKGQIVIPKKIRDALGITPETHLNLVLREGAIHMYPVSDVIIASPSDRSYLTFLEKTQGSWRFDDWDIQEKKRRKLELAEAKKSKMAW